MALGIVQSRGAEARERWEGIDWGPRNKGKESIRVDSFGTKQSQIKKKSSVAIRVELNGFDGLSEIFTQPSYTCVLLLYENLNHLGHLKSRVDGLSTGSSISLFITFPTVPGNLLRITTHFRIAQTRYCVDISVYHRYIGDDSVYRRSFKDKFVTIRAMGGDTIRNRRLHC